MQSHITSTGKAVVGAVRTLPGGKTGVDIGVNIGKDILDGRDKLLKQITSGSKRTHRDGESIATSSSTDIAALPGLKHSVDMAKKRSNSADSKEIRRDIAAGSQDDNIAKKAECVCNFRKDMGKLVVTDSYVQFRSLHHDEKFFFKDMSYVKKKGNTKVSIKTAAGKVHHFGPFDDVRRGTIFDTMKQCFDALNETGGSNGAAIDVSTIKGLNDPIMQQVFEGTDLVDAPGLFPDATDKDTLCMDIVYPISLRNLFALLHSDSSEFLTEVHTNDGDVDLSLGKWSVHESKQYFTRHFDFAKKSKLVSCLVHQTQTCRLRSPTEVVMETSNKMEGVPFADTFTVDTKWRMKEEGKDSTRLTTWVAVNFRRNPFVKGKIERSSISGTQDYFKSYGDHVWSKFSGSAPGAPEKSSKETSANTDGLALSAILAIVFGTLFALCFILWIWGWWSSSALASYASALEAQTIELEAIVEQLTQQLGIKEAAEQELRAQLAQREVEVVERFLAPEQFLEAVEQWKLSVGAAVDLLSIVADNVAQVAPDADEALATATAAAAADIL